MGLMQSLLRNPEAGNPKVPLPMPSPSLQLFMEDALHFSVSPANWLKDIDEAILRGRENGAVYLFVFTFDDNGRDPVDFVYAYDEYEACDVRRILASDGYIISEFQVNKHHG